MLDEPIPQPILDTIFTRANSGDARARLQAAVVLTSAAFVPVDLERAAHYMAGLEAPAGVSIKVNYAREQWDNQKLLAKLLATSSPEMALVAALIQDCLGQHDQAMAILSALPTDKLPLLGYILSYQAVDAARWLATSPSQHPLVIERQQELSQGSQHYQPEYSITPPNGIAIRRAFISPMACAYLKWLSAPWIGQAMTSDPVTGKPIKHPIRTNGSMTFNSGLVCPFLMWLERQLAAAVAVPATCQESTGILHYQPGQAFRSHFDAFDITQAGAEHLMRDGGQRQKTALIYLNENFSGAETDFPRLNFRFRGKMGDLLTFNNTDSEGQRDEKALHQGMSPSAGTKWVLSKWFREHPTDHGQRLHGLM
ncbi:2OG-Fe(II) oxygenase [Gallaecimonas mangrovi]|uniref:2OG-Fe(II) oxygenase n=1 Tax=Gallaecimonas mangrovi TaxID=2291597 RepID=UPI000E203774|nr:2OG-Fe(II) oxygenase [Gallaecimonas mangrovi]